MGTQLEMPLSVEEDDVGQAAVRRYYSDLGKRLEAFRLSLTNLTQQDIFVTSINIRFPIKAGDGTLLVLKGVSQEGPHIAFASGYNFTEAIFAMGGRLRSGTVEWKPDSFPHDDWQKQLEWCRKNRHLID